MKLLRCIAVMVLAVSLWGCGWSNDGVIKRELDKADKLEAAGDERGSTAALLKAQSHIDESTPLRQKIDVYTQLGARFYDAHKIEDAGRYFQKAVDAARSADSISGHPELLWNLVLTVNDIDSVKLILSECRDLSDLDDRFRPHAIRSRIALSKCHAMEGDVKTARRILDSVSSADLSDHILNAELLMQRAITDLADDDIDSGIAILEGFNRDSLSLDGNVDRYNLLYKAYKSRQDFLSALTYRDSLAICLDSIQSIRLSESISKVEREYNEKIEKERSERRSILLVGGGVVLLLVLVVLLVNRSRRLKKRQVELIEQILRLNLKLSSLHEQPDDYHMEEKTDALVTKLRLNKELFSSLPQFNLINRVNLERNAEDIPKERRKELIDAVVAQFSDVSNNLKEEFPALSADDMLLGIMSLIGMNKDVISVLLKSSDDALRQRKSRMKKMEKGRVTWKDIPNQWHLASKKMSTTCLFGQCIPKGVHRSAIHCRSESAISHMMTQGIF